MSNTSLRNDAKDDMISTSGVVVQERKRVGVTFSGGTGLSHVLQD
jgi:hypothetical protein